MTESTQPPILSTPRFWWDGTLSYINPGKENHQRYSALLLSCVSQWAGYVDAGKFFGTAANFWRGRDFIVGFRSLEEMGTTLWKTGRVTSKLCINTLADLANGFSSLGALISDFHGRGILAGFAIEPIQLGGGALGMIAFAKKTWDAGLELSKAIEEGDRLKQIEKLSSLISVVCVFAIKTLGVVAIVYANSRVRLVQVIIAQQRNIVFGCLTTIMGASLVGHFTKKYIEQLKKGA